MPSVCCAGHPKVHNTFARVSGYVEQTGGCCWHTFVAGCIFNCWISRRILTPCSLPVPQLPFPRPARHSRAICHGARGAAAERAPAPAQPHQPAGREDGDVCARGAGAAAAAGASLWGATKVCCAAASAATGVSRLPGLPRLYLPTSALPNPTLQTLQLNTDHGPDRADPHRRLDGGPARQRAQRGAAQGAVVCRAAGEGGQGGREA